jgi:prefoldin subunit 5
MNVNTEVLHTISKFIENANDRFNQIEERLDMIEARLYGIDISVTEVRELKAQLSKPKPWYQFW